MDPVALLESKGFKRVAYKRNPEKRRPCYYRNFPKGCQGKRYTRLLVYVGSDDLLVCWETKIWPARYRSKGIKLRLPGLDDDALLNAMRAEWKHMTVEFDKAKMRDVRKPATEGEVQVRVDQLAGTPTSDILGQLAVSMVKALGLEDVQELAKVVAAKKRRRKKGPPSEQMSLPFGE
jgi:hypothetical protein